MIDYRETLKKLHEKFPHLTIDELIEILDSIVEGYYDWNRIYTPQPITTTISDPITNPKIWCQTMA